jgi:hypothetical protein
VQDDLQAAQLCGSTDEGHTSTSHATTGSSTTLEAPSSPADGKSSTSPADGKPSTQPNKPADAPHPSDRTSTSRALAYRPATTQESHVIPGGGGPTFGASFDPSRLDTRYTYRPPQHPVFGLTRPHPQFPLPSDNSQPTAPTDSSPTDQKMASTQPTTPSHSPSNSYAPIFLTPLQDTARRDANDYYLSGREGLNSVADFHYSYYSNLGLPGDTFLEVQYMFSDLIGFWSTPNVRRDKLSKSFNRLTSLEPAEFLDFYAYLSNELIHYNIALMPFDAIDINYGYMGICFPGVGERRYLQMTTRIFKCSIMPSLTRRALFRWRHASMGDTNRMAIVFSGTS